jgi:fructokinase
MLSGLRFANLVKVNEEELEFLTGEPEMARAARQLWHEDMRLLVVTRGGEGCAYFTPDAEGAAPAFRVDVVDTTGAGDGFVAGLLSGLLDTGLDWNTASLQHAMRLGNAVGALTTTQRGAIPSLPVRETAQRLSRDPLRSDCSRYTANTSLKARGAGVLRV